MDKTVQIRTNPPCLPKISIFGSAVEKHSSASHKRFPEEALGQEEKRPPW